MVWPHGGRRKPRHGAGVARRSPPRPSVRQWAPPRPASGGRPAHGAPSGAARARTLALRPRRRRAGTAADAAPTQLRDAWRPVGFGARRGVGIQIVSCDSAHIGPDTGRGRFSRTFVGEPGNTASLRYLSPCLGGTSGSDAEAGLARILSFRQEPPSGPVRARCYERMRKTTRGPGAAASEAGQGS